MSFVSRLYVSIARYYWDLGGLDLYPFLEKSIMNKLLFAPRPQSRIDIVAVSLVRFDQVADRRRHGHVDGDETIRVRYR